MQEKEHVISILRDAKKAIEEDDSLTIRDLSNQTIHSASIYKDPDNISIAVILYALSKIIERQGYRELEGWKNFSRVYNTAITRGINDIKKGDLEHYRIHIDEIRSSINKIYGPLKKEVDDVFRKAQINKASKLYEHGLSMEKTAKILGITVWELNQYVGQSSSANISLSQGINIKARLNLALDFFK